MGARVEPRSTDEVKLATVAVKMRADEVDVIDELAAGFEGEYAGNRSAALRLLLREAMDARGIGVDPLVEVAS